MSRDRVMPAYFVRMRADGSTPWAATLTMSAVNLVLLALALGTTSIAAALSNAATSLGLISIVFYGLTAAAALRHLRRQPGAGRVRLNAGVLFPLIGVLFSVFVLIGSFATGVFSPAVAAYGLGSIGLGALIALILRNKGAHFFAPLKDEPPP